MVTIQVDHGTLGNIHKDFILRVADEVLDELKLNNAEMSISVVGNQRIRELNNQFLGINEVTDVLSFPSKEIDPETGKIYLGDVAIALPVIKKQAKEAGHNLNYELALMIVHGILHLAGFDHDTKQNQQKMFSLQTEILAMQINLANMPNNNSLLSSFGFAFTGIFSAFQSERNMWIHLGAAMIVLIFGLLFEVSAYEWGLLVLCIAMVFSTELINTALEYTVNQISQERNYNAKRIKDISAAAVLITSLAAAVIGLVIFLPRVINLMEMVF